MGKGVSPASMLTALLLTMAAVAPAQTHSGSLQATLETCGDRTLSHEEKLAGLVALGWEDLPVDQRRKVDEAMAAASAIDYAAEALRMPGDEGREFFLDVFPGVVDTRRDLMAGLIGAGDVSASWLTTGADDARRDLVMQTWFGPEIRTDETGSHHAPTFCEVSGTAPFSAETLGQMAGEIVDVNGYIEESGAGSRTVMKPDSGYAPGRFGDTFDVVTLSRDVLHGRLGLSTDAAFVVRIATTSPAPGPDSE